VSPRDPAPDVCRGRRNAFSQRNYDPEAMGFRRKPHE
jgi:hypothetical protein